MWTSERYREPGTDGGRAGTSAEPPRPASLRLPSPSALHEALRSDGEELLDRGAQSWFLSGLGGGLTIAFSVTTAAVIHASLPAATWAELVVPLGATVGYLIIILGRQGLITESAMITALQVLSRHTGGTITQFAGVLAVVSFANVLGAFVIAALLTGTALLDPASKDALTAMASKTAAVGAGALFVRSIVAGWAIALAVWTAPAAGSAKVLMIFVLAYITGVLHLPHMSAGSIEILHLVFSGTVHWTTYARFLPVVLCGNTLGAFVMVALLNHLQVSAQRSAKDG